ncbi:MAG: hypothetical protein EBZ59_02530 [Planctomycetia bacterium]|nr:hypothetical protein [Planctomycetia bacterium]
MGHRRALARFRRGTPRCGDRLVRRTGSPFRRAVAAVTFLPPHASARATGGPAAGGPASLPSRAVVAGVLIGLFCGLAWADATGLGGAPPAWWLLPLAVAVAVGAVDEMARLFAVRQIALPVWLLRPATVAVVLSAAVGGQAAAPATAAATAATGWEQMGWPALALVFAVVGLFVLEIVRYRPHGGSIERLAAGCLLLAYVGLPLAFIVSLRLLCVENIGPEQTGGGHLGIVPLASLVAVVKAGDIAAYVLGSFCGRHRMVPVLSPGKTWEGAVASLAGSLAAAWAVLSAGGMPAEAGPWGGWPVFGAAVGAAGMLGDLGESLLKRELGAKDSGRSLAGLGGVLDLVDSLLFAAPVAWTLWVLAR